ncbi:alpha/beta hydrolase [Mesorhizobium sp. M9A.F.Ca.ET.002.03.1.2]|uniref:alpha/beta fold hydrolase n=1 Tax=Mesorhizobium sp. M9A.F.Ca.ET.002.03.1.2 TaxID=2493668 RepID=UPI001AEC8C1A|nr:alpha/beta hydrolase [Mesorhizobium sp. M9A.F.Ca.ET.002.03.1.2]
MTVASILCVSRQARRAPLVVALHCSGGSARQWRKFAERLDEGCRFVAPDLIGAPGGSSWAGSGTFSLADEAAGTIEMIDNHEGPVHLVGHSYGGGLALHIAAMRPHRLASLGLYEPSAFHLLNGMGSEGRVAFEEISAVAGAIAEGLNNGSYRAAAACFVDYWNGPGTFAAMKPDLQAELVRFLSKASLDFHALIHEPTHVGEYSRFGFPVVILRGEHAPVPTRLIAQELVSRIPAAIGVIIPGAGHMGPMTHADVVADRLVRDILFHAVKGSRAA